MGDLIVLPESDALKAEIETLRQSFPRCLHSGMN